MPKQQFDLNLRISFDEDDVMDEGFLVDLVRQMVEEGLPDSGQTKDLEVKVSLSVPPKVLVVVNNGAGEVRAVTGVADIALVDQDREGETLHEDDIEAALEFERHEGSSGHMTVELHNARTALEAYCDDTPQP